MPSDLHRLSEVERYAKMILGNDFLRVALDSAIAATIAGDKAGAQVWGTTAAGIVVMLEAEHIPITLSPKGPNT